MANSVENKNKKGLKIGLTLACAFFLAYLFSTVHNRNSNLPNPVPPFPESKKGEPVANEPSRHLPVTSTKTLHGTPVRRFPNCELFRKAIAGLRRTNASVFRERTHNTTGFRPPWIGVYETCDATPEEAQSIHSHFMDACSSLFRPGVAVTQFSSPGEAIECQLAFKAYMAQALALEKGQTPISELTDPQILSAIVEVSMSPDANGALEMGAALKASSRLLQLLPENAAVAKAVLLQTSMLRPSGDGGDSVSSAADTWRVARTALNRLKQLEPSSPILAESTVFVATEGLKSSLIESATGKLMASDPNNGAAFYYRAALEQQKGNLDKARYYQDQAQSRDSSNILFQQPLPEPSSESAGGYLSVLPGFAHAPFPDYIDLEN